MYKEFRTRFYVTCLLIGISTGLSAQNYSFPLNDAWVQKIRTIAPTKSDFTPKKARKVLVFSLFTGYDHWVIPHTNAVLQVLSEKTGAFVLDVSTDIQSFEKRKLAEYDAIIINNTCSIGPRRDLFLDVLDKDAALSTQQKNDKAKELESNLLRYVTRGGGLMVIHGAIVMQNNSQAISDMVGGSFDYHPAMQEVTLELSEPNHPLSMAFEGKPFVHVDEPYLFNKAYDQKNFRPLLFLRASQLTKKSKALANEINYVSWIKKFGKGRVFYVSPSHNAQSFEDARLLKFYLNGIQYVTGDFPCDDSPM